MTIDLAMSSSPNLATASVIKSGQTPLSSPASLRKYGVSESVARFGSRLENVSIRNGTFLGCQEQNVPLCPKSWALWNLLWTATLDQISGTERNIIPPSSLMRSMRCVYQLTHRDQASREQICNNSYITSSLLSISRPSHSHNLLAP